MRCGALLRFRPPVSREDFSWRAGTPQEARNVVDEDEKKSMPRPASSSPSLYRHPFPSHSFSMFSCLRPYNLYQARLRSSHFSQIWEWFKTSMKDQYSWSGNIHIFTRKHLDTFIRQSQRTQRHSALSASNDPTLSSFLSSETRNSSQQIKISILE